MKRILAFLLVISTVLCFSACLWDEAGSKNENNSKTGDNKDAGETGIVSKDVDSADYGSWSYEKDKKPVENGKGNCYSNEAIDLRFVIPYKDVYEKGLWIEDDEIETDDDGAVRVMSASRVAPKDEKVLLNNVAVYMERVGGSVGVEAYIKQVAEDETFDGTKPEKIDEDGLWKNREAWMIKRTVTETFEETVTPEPTDDNPDPKPKKEKVEKSANQCIIIYKTKQNYMVTVIITADSEQIDTIKNGWFRTFGE